MDAYTLKLDKKHGLPREGAAIVRSDDDRTALRLDYTLGRFTGLGFRARTDSEDGTIAGLVKLPGLTLSAKLEHPLFRSFGMHTLGASLDWSEGDLWAHWDPEVLGESCADLGAVVFGERHQRTEVTGTYATELRLPEGSYPCVVSLDQISLWRERAPKLTQKIFPAASLRFITPPPFPGKDGEDDFITSSYLPGVVTAGEALGQVYGRVMRQRELRGGLGWKPTTAPVNEHEGIASEQSVPIPPDAPNVTAVQHWLQVPGDSFAIRAYQVGFVGLVVVKLDRLGVDGDVFVRRVAPRLAKVAASLPGTSSARVALVVSESERILALDENGILTPFDLSAWPGSPAVFF